MHIYISLKQVNIIAAFYKIAAFLTLSTLQITMKESNIHDNKRTELIHLKHNKGNTISWIQNNLLKFFK